MKNYIKIFSYSMFILLMQHNSVMAIAEKAGIETFKAAEPIIKAGLVQFDKTGGVLAAGMKEFGAVAVDKAGPILADQMDKFKELVGQLAVTGGTLAVAAENAGANIGVGALELIGSGCTTSCTAIKATCVAFAAANPVTTTIITVTCVIVIVSYGSYKVYKIFRRVWPNEEKQAKINLEIAKSQAATAAFKATEEKSQKEAALKSALIQHASSSEKTASGIPVACLKHAQELAIVAGQKKVDKITTAFVKYGPQAQAAMAARA